MAETDSRTSGIAERLIALFLCAGLTACGAYLVKASGDKTETLNSIHSLEEEKEQLSKEIDETLALVKETESKITEINSLDETIKAQRDDYYAACKALEDAVNEGTSDHKIAYLTFDDGPYVKTTGKYLDVLKEKDVLATFFQMGRTAEGHDELYHRVYEEGHTIANHTYSHTIRNGIYRNMDSFVNDVVKNREFIEEKLGYTTNILRFPGGSGTAVSRLGRGVKQKVNELGYGWVDWNSATGDGLELLSPAQYRDNVLKKTGNTKVLVVLMHDYSANTLAALPEIIDGLRQQGYVLLPLFYDSCMINK